MWNNDEALNAFNDFWLERPKTVRQHSPEIWDKRAERWEGELRTDEGRKKRSNARIRSVVNFLKENGALEEDYNVIDIGCGPGRFVAEFSKYVNHAAGTDYSDTMCRFGEEFSKENGITNTEFIPCDFKAADIHALGWEKAFDLVFSCITPAVNSKESVEKTMQMSRKWCFNGTFVNAYDELAEDIARDVLGRPLPKKWDGRSLYALFNIIWLEGYFPRVSYYYEKSRCIYEADEKTARRMAEKNEIEPDDETIGKILKYLEEKKQEKGVLDYAFDFTYAWLLWDITEKTERNTYNG